MKNSRRMKRMARNHSRTPKMNLTSLMDVFTILVFFLLVNSANTEVLETPKQITLPASTVEEKPRETVVIFVSPTEALERALSQLTLGTRSRPVPGVFSAACGSGGSPRLFRGRAFLRASRNGDAFSSRDTGLRAASSS